VQAPWARHLCRKPATENLAPSGATSASGHGYAVPPGLEIKTVFDFYNNVAPAVLGGGQGWPLDQ
jgi:hypothetical protein